MANVTVGDISLLARCTGFLDPFARWFGLDGVILMAFILGWPANEIVLPVMLMAYLSAGSLVEFDSLAALGELLTQQGWTWLTAVCAMLFSLFHWPCSTTCLTVYKETGSVKWTALAVVLPTALGLGLCLAVTAAARLLGVG
jgi:ferrous iron transport protein B